MYGCMYYSWGEKSLLFNLGIFFSDLPLSISPASPEPTLKVYTYVGPKPINNEIFLNYI